MAIDTNLSVPEHRIPKEGKTICILRGTGSKRQQTTYSIPDGYDYVDYHLGETHPGTYKIKQQVLEGRFAVTNRENNSFQASGNTGVEGAYSILRAKVGGRLSSEETESSMTTIENNRCTVIQAYVSGGKRGGCCCGDVSSFALNIILQSKNIRLHPAGSTAVATTELNSPPVHISSSSPTEPDYDALLNQEVENGVYLLAKCINRKCDDYFKKKLIYEGKVKKEPCTFPSKLYTSSCPCCKNSGTLECNEVGIKGVKYKWEGLNGDKEKKLGEWEGSRIKHELINLSGWAYFDLTHCE